jgi:hypothetical protein
MHPELERSQESGARERQIGGDAGRSIDGPFYGMYAAASGLVIAISLTVDVAKNYRVFWALFDTGLVAYVCLYNPWFRNRQWSERLTKVEER